MATNELCRCCAGAKRNKNGIPCPRCDGTGDEPFPELAPSNAAHTLGNKLPPPNASPK